MTLEKLIERLQGIAQERPELLGTEVVCRSRRKVQDKRTRMGYRVETTWCTIKYGCSGQITLPGGSYVELIGDEIQKSG